MSISEQIHEAAARHEMETGKRPNALYVGTREDSALYRLIAETETCHAPRQIAGYPPRATYASMEIFRVNATEHLACGRIEAHAVAPAPKAEPEKSVFTLEELHAILAEKFGEGCRITSVENPMMGTAVTELRVGDDLRASWKSRLVKEPPRDGKTPRGPAEYYDLKFYPATAEKGTA